MRAREEEELAECTFRPLINASGSGGQTPRTSSRQQYRRGSGGSTPTPILNNVSDLAPLHERVGEVLRNRSEKIANARISMVRRAQGEREEGNS